MSKTLPPAGVADVPVMRPVIPVPDLVRSTFQFEAQDPLQLPAFSGSAIRGGFGAALRVVGCRCGPRGPDHRDDCAYATLFEPIRRPPGSTLTGVPKVPPPFVLEPPLRNLGEVPIGERFDIGIVLIGPACSLAPALADAFEVFGRMGVGPGRGRFHVKSVDSASVRIPIVETQGAISVEFVTPTRITADGAVTPTLSFQLLYKNIARRLALLNHFHAGIPWASSLPLLAEAAQVQLRQASLRWYPFRRYSSRQDREMSLDGFVGSVTYTGDLAPFAGHLGAATLLGVGKGTTMGMGRCVVRSAIPLNSR